MNLFTTLTLPLLELFKFGKNKDIEGHIQWYMVIIEKQLNKLSLTDNEVFIGEFSIFFEKVMDILRSTQNKFDINYRSVFAFEEWVNIEKFNIPFRLNHYIHETFISLPQKKENFSMDLFISHCTLIFRLMKEKNVFESNYRKLMINRIISNYEDYNMET